MHLGSTYLIAKDFTAFIKKILEWMKNRKYFAKMVTSLERKSENKSASIIKYEFVGLL